MKHRLVLVLLALASLVALIAVSRPAAPASADENLSSPASAPRATSLRPPPSSGDSASSLATASPSASAISHSALHRVLPTIATPPADWRAYNPARLTVSPTPNARFTFERTAFKPGGVHGEFTVWTGRNPDNPGATLIGVAHDRGWTGTLSLPGANEYRIDVHDDQVTVFPKIRGLCEPAVAFAETTAAPSPLFNSTTTAAAAETAAAVVDVLFFYGDEIVQRYGEADVQRRVELEAVSQIERANRILEQSRISALQWRFAGAERVPAYAKPNDMSDDLRLFASSNNSVGQFVRSRVDAVGADQAVLYITDRRSQSANTAGIAHTPGHHSVVLIQADAQTTTHELAHNFGCHHDRRTDSAPDGNGRYYYGHRFTFRNRDGGTVMSYASSALPYFSNPAVQVDSSIVVFGTNEKLTLGVPADQPRAADNARYLGERAQAMAGTRSPRDAPRITAQPRSVTVTSGQSFSLGVTATGPGLAYQWSRDGAALPGATTATYSKSNAETTDAGSYTVTVTNGAGRVISAAAVVTVNPAASPSAPSSPPSSSPSPNTSSGGGGGGGAPSLWFCAALALLGALRLLRRDHPQLATVRNDDATTRLNE